MRVWSLALVLCASQVAAQELDKTVEVRVQDAPKNPQTFLRTDQGRGAGIRGAKLSPDGKLVVLYGHDSGDPNLANPQSKGTLQIWDVAQRRLVFDLVAHRDGVMNVRWSRDAKWLASESQDGEILLWDATTGKLAHRLSPALEMPDFSVMMSAKADKETTPEKQLEQWTNVFAKPKLLGFALDGQQVLALAGKATLPPLDKAEIPTDTTKAILNFSDLITPQLRVWNVADGSLARAVTFGNAGDLMLASALGDDGRSFTFLPYAVKNGGVKRIETRDSVSGALQSSFEITGDFDYPIALSADGQRVVVLKKQDNDVARTRAQIWDVTTQKPLQVLADSNADFSHTAFRDDNKTLLVGGRTGDILIFDLQNGALKKRLSGGHWGEIATIDMTPDDQILLSVGSQDSVVQLWDLTKAAGATLQAKALVQDYNARQIMPAPDGSFWLGYNNTDWSTDLRKGKSLEVRHLSADGEEIEKISIPETFLVDGITFSSDFKLVAGYLNTMPQPALIEDAGVGVWDLEQKKLLWQAKGKNFSGALSFAPDNRTLVVGHGEAIELWDIESGKLLRQLLKTSDARGISALTFSKDGQTLAIGSEGTIQMLDMESGEVRDEVTEDFVPRAIVFSPDGKYLLSGGNIEIGWNPVGFKVTLRDAKTHELLHEWSHDKGVAEDVGQLRYEGKDDGARFFGGLTFSPDSKLLAFAHYGNLMRIDRAQTEIWDIASNTRVGLIPDRASAQAPTFALDGKSVFTTDSNWIKSWQLSDVLAQNEKP